MGKNNKLLTPLFQMRHPTAHRKAAKAEAGASSLRPRLQPLFAPPLSSNSLRAPAEGPARPRESLSVARARFGHNTSVSRRNRANF